MNHCRNAARRRSWSASIAVALLLLAFCVAAARGAETGPFQATGFKIGEVTDTSAIVWTRLTLHQKRNPADGPMVTIEYEPAAPGVGRRDRTVKAVVYPDGTTVGDIRYAVPGVDGDVRVLLRKQGARAWRETAWRSVDPLGDFTRQFRLDGLEPGTRYQVRVEARGVDGAAGEPLEGRFRTAPAPQDAARVVFTVVTGFGNNDEDSPEGFKIHKSMAALDPDFFVHTGDIIYYDELAKSVDLARYHWQKMYGWPNAVSFHTSVASFFIKDDHDTWRDDCWPTMQSPYMHEFTFRQGQAIFREQVPMGELTYRTRRYGKDLQVWFVEGRDYRSANDMPDGPDKTIWGPQQKRWFTETLAASDAVFRVLISPTPLVGPDRDTKRDNHSNRVFQHEGSQLRRFLAGQRDSIVICGDRHWQYMSVDPATGLREYSCGPASDVHAGGWQQSDYRPDYHKFLRVQGGFLSATVERVDEIPVLTLRFHDVDGGIKYEDRITAGATQAD